MTTVLWGLVGLGASAFLSSTVLPGNSELALSAFLYKWPGAFWLAILIATIANSGGSATSLLLGRFLPNNNPSKRVKWWFNRYGPPVLSLSWLPVIGDILPVAAGWLRLPWWSCLFWLTLGKMVRYLIVGSVILALAME